IIGERRRVFTYNRAVKTTSLTVILLAGLAGTSPFLLPDGSGGRGGGNHNGGGAGGGGSARPPHKHTNTPPPAPPPPDGRAPRPGAHREAGPEPGRPDSRPRRALHVDLAADDRGARSGNRPRDLDAHPRQGRRAKPRCVVLARRPRIVATNFRRYHRRTPDRA